GGALRVRPAAESEWLTCGAGSRVSACGKYADLCRQRTARATTTTTTTTTIVNAGQPKAVMAIFGDFHYGETKSVFEEFEECFYQKPNKGSCDARRSDHAQQQLVNPAVKEGETVTELTQPTLAGRDLQPSVLGGNEQSQDSSNDLARGKADASQNGGPETQDNLVKGETVKSPSTTQITSEGSTSATQDDAVPHGDQGTPNNTSDNTATGEHKPNQPSPTAAESAAPREGSSGNQTPGTTAADSQETNTTTLPSAEKTTTEAPTTTPSPVPNAEINTIASTVLKNKANVDSSVNPVWVRVPLLIVAVFFSATVY
ncbi:uncharacterized protein TM35_000531050, partial [Trypanosoma theileri]